MPPSLARLQKSFISIEEEYYYNISNLKFVQNFFAEFLMTQTQAWRTLANSFHHLPRIIQGGKLPANYTPQDMIEAYRSEPLSTSERSLFSFLLHVWNRYEFQFDLAEICFWDDGHRNAFLSWVNGKTLGTPCRYF